MSTALDEYREFLAETLPTDYDDDYRAYRDDEALRRRFQALSFEAGWLVPEWPSGLGGRDLPVTEALSVRIEGFRRRAPRQMNIQGTGVIAPAIRTFGTPAQQQEYLLPTLRGDAWWALGMSEPGAGSDLGSLRTTAVRRGDVFIANGQKVWTTQADSARWCALYARTDPEAPKHRGISCLIVDMDTPGITVKPIRTAGPAIESFSEVFFDDVAIPAQNLLGELNGGWSVAMSALEHERDMIWIHNWLEMQRALDPVLAAPLLPDHHLERLGHLMADLESIRLSGIRSVGARTAGVDDGIASMLKLFGSEAVQAAAALALDVGSLAGHAPLPEFDEYLESLAASLYGGTSEIQRNIIARRLLDLGKE